jgi:hypothetical protein
MRIRIRIYIRPRTGSSQGAHRKDLETGCSFYRDEGDELACDRKPPAAVAFRRRSQLPATASLHHAVIADRPNYGAPPG